MLALGKSGWTVYGGSLYYCGDLSVHLELFKNNKKKLNFEKIAVYLLGVSSQSVMLAGTQMWYMS